MSKTTNGVTTKFIWDGGNLVLEYVVTNLSELEADYRKVYVYGADGLAYRRDLDGTVYTYNTNYRGDVLSVMDDEQNIMAEYMFDAYGNLVTSYNEDGFSDNFGYRGEYHDPESGYIYLRNRYLDPKTGSFTTEDPARDGLNWFAYCGGNPVKCTDPWGLGPNDYFLSYDDAAIDFGMNYNGKTIDKPIAQRLEYGSAIIEVKISGATFYTYNEPVVSKSPVYRDGGYQWYLIIPKVENQVGEIHTHAGNIGVPSVSDTKSSAFRHLKYYYITGGEGFVTRFWPSKKTEGRYEKEIIYTLLPKRFGENYVSNLGQLSSSKDIEKKSKRILQRILSRL